MASRSTRQTKRRKSFPGSKKFTEIYVEQTIAHTLKLSERFVAANPEATTEEISTYVWRRMQPTKSTLPVKITQIPERKSKRSRR